jgi:3',5'-cyclic AMP phosphodiesterase CpdA
MKKFFAGIFFIAVLSNASCQKITQEETISHLNSSEIEKIKQKKIIKKEFEFVIMGDNRDGDEVFAKIIEDINELKPEPAFVVNIGDLVSTGRLVEYKKFVQTISKSKYPFLCAIGNHDWIFGGYRHFERIFGPRYFSFDIDDLRFIFLDNAGGTLSDEQVLWLEKLLKEGRKSFLFAHIPPPIESWRKHSFAHNADRFLKLIDSKNGIVGAFFSHIHGFSVKMHNGVTCIVSGGAGAPLVHRYIGDVEHIFHFIKITVKEDRSLSYRVFRYPTKEK